MPIVYNKKQEDGTFYSGPEQPISSATFQQQEPLDLPDAPQPSTYDSTSIPITDLFAEMDASSATEQQGNDIESRLQSSYDKLSGKTAYSQEKETQLGLPGLRENLTGVNNQLLALQNEYKAIPLITQQQATGRGITTAGLAPITMAKQRENAIQSLGLSSISQALQGNIALASQQVDRAVALEFEPEEQKIAYLTQALERNDKKLAREDSKKAQKLQIQLDERRRSLDNAKEDKKIIYGWAAEAAKVGGAPQLIIDRALKANSPTEALAILSPYFQDPNAKEMALADLEYKRTQIALGYASINKVRAETAQTYAQTAQIKADTASPKPIDAKEFQYKANLFVQRLSNANSILSKNTQSIRDYSPFTYQALSAAENTTVGNATIVPSVIQSQRQAERDFLNAVLRRESGAVISPTEFAEGSKQYFPRPGDGDDVKAQKELNRQTVITALQSEAGPAFQSAQTTTQQPSQIMYQGKKYNVDASGNLTPA